MTVYDPSEDSRVLGELISSSEALAAVVPSAGAAFTKRAPAPRPTPIVNVVVTMPLALFESEAVVLNPPLHGSVLVGKFHDEEDALRSGLVTDIAELIYVWVVGEDVNGVPVSMQLFVFRQESAPATT